MRAMRTLDVRYALDDAEPALPAPVLRDLVVAPAQHAHALRDERGVAVREEREKVAERPAGVRGLRGRVEERDRPLREASARAGEKDSGRRTCVAGTPAKKVASSVTGATLGSGPSVRRRKKGVRFEWIDACTEASYRF